MALRLKMPSNTAASRIRAREDRTWNVNGIRARQAQVQEFIDREQPDVLCLQEIKASIDQLPVWLCDIEGYWCYWHGGKGYSGVGLHVRKASVPGAAGLRPPRRSTTRIASSPCPNAARGPRTVASIYVPNGGKDFPAKMRFLEALDAFAVRFTRPGIRSCSAAISTWRGRKWTSIRRNASARHRAASRKNAR